MFEESQIAGEYVGNICGAGAFAPAGVTPYVHRIEGSLARCVRALVALDMHQVPWRTLRLLPRASFIVWGAFAAGDDAFAGTAAGTATRYSGAGAPGNTLRAGGSGFSYYALLTPLGVVTLFEGRRIEGLPSCASLANKIFEAREIRHLEHCMACAPNGEQRLCRFGNWLEQRAVARRRVATAATRVARVAARLHNVPSVGIEALASDEGLSRRQLERDFRRHLDVSPSHYAGGIRL